eukprot:1310923-Prymnesium_polylepis.1
MHLRVNRGTQLSAARVAELACYDNTSWMNLLSVGLRCSSGSSTTLWHRSDSGVRTFLRIHTNLSPRVCVAVVPRTRSARGHFFAANACCRWPALGRGGGPTQRRGGGAACARRL